MAHAQGTGLQVAGMTIGELAVGTAVFVVELALFAGLAVTGWRIGHRAGPVAGTGLAAALVVGAGALWGRWMSPNADARLDLWPRILVAVLLLAVAGAGLAVTGSAHTGIALATIGAVIVAAGNIALA